MDGHLHTGRRSGAASSSSMSSSRGGALTVRGAPGRAGGRPASRAPERRAAELADGAQRLLRIAELAGLGLHHHRGHVVADHVMQLARDRGALLQPGGLPAQLLRLASTLVRVRERSRRAAARRDTSRGTARRCRRRGRTARGMRPGEAAHPAEPGLRRGSSAIRDEHQRPTAATRGQRPGSRGRGSRRRSRRSRAAGLARPATAQRHGRHRDEVDRVARIWSRGSRRRPRARPPLPRRRTTDEPIRPPAIPPRPQCGRLRCVVVGQRRDRYRGTAGSAPRADPRREGPRRTVVT